MRWLVGSEAPAFDGGGVAAHAGRFREPAFIVRDPGGRAGVGVGGRLASAGDPSSHASFALSGILPPIYPEWLGGPGFCSAHGVRFPYVAGEMGNGIATPRLVVNMARAGMLGFFGAAGLGLEQVHAGIDAIERALGVTRPAWGVNLIHSPAEPALELALAEALVARDVRHVCVSAFMTLTPAVALCAAQGLRRGPGGRIERRRQIFAKLSRPELAERFMAPLPLALLEPLVQRGLLTRAELELARELPVAEDITVEADSGGHTDNRPLSALLPAILAVRARVLAEQRPGREIRVGAAGGLGTPGALAAAFALGASYVVTGSINQSALESGLSERGKRALAGAGIAT